MGALGRAKIRTLKMTVIIVTTFFFCWTPYNVMSLWYWFDRKSAQEVDQRIQKGLFLFACTNSCVNPLIYGMFHVRARKNGSITHVPRSLPNGYHRPPIPSENENFKMRVRWRPNECCIMGCGSSGNVDTTQNVSSIRERPVFRRPTHQYWLGNSTRKDTASGHATRRDITTAITNGHIHHHLDNRTRQGHSGHRRCSNFQMTEVIRQHVSYHATTSENRIHIENHSFVNTNDKNSNRGYVSSVL